MALPARNCETCSSRIDSIFCKLPSEHLQELNQHKTTNRYARGQTLFYEGNPSAGLFCIGNGKVKVFKSGNNGKEVILELAQEGSVLGYWNTLLDRNFSTSAEVIEDAEICFVDKNFLQHLIAKDSSLALQVILRLGGELANAEERITDGLNRDVRQRFIRLLLTLRKTHGEKDQKGTLLDVRLTRNELGAMVGATPETVIRLLSDLRESGAVVLDAKKIILKDTEALLREAEIDA